jgi:hypothetical protein
MMAVGQALNGTILAFGSNEDDRSTDAKQMAITNSEMIRK